MPDGSCGDSQRNTVITQALTWQGTEMKYNFSNNFFFCFLPEAELQDRGIRLEVLKTTVPF